MSSATKPQHPASPPVDGWLTVPQAARALGIASATVLQRALQGELETQTVAGRTFVKRASVEKAIERQSKA